MPEDFDPDAFLAAPAPAADDFDPDAFLTEPTPGVSIHGGKALDTSVAIKEPRIATSNVDPSAFEIRVPPTNPSLAPAISAPPAQVAAAKEPSFWDTMGQAAGKAYGAGGGLGQTGNVSKDVFGPAHDYVSEHINMTGRLAAGLPLTGTSETDAKNFGPGKAFAGDMIRDLSPVALDAVMYAAAPESMLSPFVKAGDTAEAIIQGTKLAKKFPALARLTGTIAGGAIEGGTLAETHSALFTPEKKLGESFLGGAAFGVVGRGLRNVLSDAAALGKKAGLRPGAPTPQPEKAVGGGQSFRARQASIEAKAAAIEAQPPKVVATAGADFMTDVANETERLVHPKMDVELSAEQLRTMPEADVDAALGTTRRATTVREKQTPRPYTGPDTVSMRAERGNTQVIGGPETKPRYHELAKWDDPTFRPSLATVGTDESGRLTGYITQLRPGQAPIVATIPMESRADFNRVGTALKTHDLTLTGVSDAAKSALATVHPEWHALISSPQDQRIVDAQPKTNESPVAFQRRLVAAKSKTLAPPPNLDAPSFDGSSQPVNLVATGGGEVKATPYVPTTPQAPTAAPVALDPGTQVAIADPKGGAKSPFIAQAEGAAKFTKDTAVRGKMLGPDTAAPGKSRVLLPDGQIQSFPSAHLHPLTAPGQARFPGMQAGAPVPVPSQPVPMAEVSPQTANDARIIYNLAQEMVRAGNPTLMEKVMQGALADHLRPPKDIGQLIQKLQAAPGLFRTVKKEQLAAFRAQMPKKAIFDVAANDLAKVRSKDMTMDAYVAKHPEVGKGLKAMAQEVFERMDWLDTQLQAHGQVDPSFAELRESGEMDPYMAQMYYAHVMGKGEWLKTAPADTFNDAINLITEQHAKHPNGWDRAQIAQELTTLVNAEQPVVAFLKSEMSKPFDNLLKRNKLPPAIEKALGKVESGPMRIAVSLATQEALHLTGSVWHEIWNTRTPDALGRQINPYWSPTWRADLPVKVPDNPRVFGHAAGGYISKDMSPLVGASKIDLSQGLLMQRVFLQHFKRNTLSLGGLQPFVSNFIRNLPSAVAAGGIDPWHPIASGSAMMNGIKELLSHGGITLGSLNVRNPNPSPSSVISEMRRAGALPGGSGAVEGGADAQHALNRQIAQELGTLKKPGFMDVMGGFRNVHDKWVTTRTQAATFYDFLDQVWRVGSYINIKNQKLKEAAAAGIQGQAAIEYAAREAATLLNRYFNHAERVGGIVSKMRGTAGQTAYFLQGQAEDIRTKAMMAKDIAIGRNQEMLPPPGQLTTDPNTFRQNRTNKKDHSLKWRMLGAGTWLAGMYAALRIGRHMNGITQEDVDASLAMNTDKKQVYDPNFSKVVLPFRGDDGKPVTWQSGQMFTEFQYGQGDPNDSLGARIATNLALTPVAGTRNEAAWRKYIEDTGFVRPLPTMDEAYIRGNQGWKQVLDQMLKDRILPGVVPNTQETLRKMGAVGSLGRKETGLSTAGGLMKLGGLSMKPTPSIPGVDANAAAPIMATAGELQQYQKDAMAKIHMVQSRQYSRDVDEDKQIKQELRKSILDELQIHIKAFKDRQAAVHKAQLSHQLDQAKQATKPTKP